MDDDFRGAAQGFAAYSEGDLSPVRLHNCHGTLCPATSQEAVHLQRADEVQQQEPKVAYYCRLYAVHQVDNIQPCGSRSSKQKRTLLVRDLVLMVDVCVNIGVVL